MYDAFRGGGSVIVSDKLGVSLLRLALCNVRVSEISILLELF